jgi:polygalacturonase
MKNLSRRIAVAVLMAWMGAGAARAEPRIFLGNDYGAKGDGKSLNTVSIQRAIDAAAAAGGTVALKPGIYLTGSLFLKSGVTLDVGEGVTLIGSESLKDYPMLPTRIAGADQCARSA